jgi:hypothetical protein
LNNYDRLVDKQSIKVAEQKLRDVYLKREQVDEQEKAATLRFAAANETMKLAIVGKADINSARTEREASIKELDEIELAASAWENAISEAEAELRTATGRAHAPLWNNSLQRIMNAAAAHDAALAQLEAAKAEFLDARSDLEIAVNNGGGLDLKFYGDAPSVANFKPILQGSNIDPEALSNPWHDTAKSGN